MFGLKRQPRLSQKELSELRKEWSRSTPLVTCDCGPERISAVLAGFSADDLHALAHGESVEDGTLAEAIVRHPLCDRASALEVIHSYSASAYQSYWREGRSEESFSDLDRTLFRAFATVAERAASEGFRTDNFRHNLDLKRRFRETGEPDGYHPQDWVRWRLPAGALKPTGGQWHKPDVSLEGGKVLPRFELWLERRKRLN